jgi:hypothetical protein
MVPGACLFMIRTAVNARTLPLSASFFDSWKGGQMKLLSQLTEILVYQKGV